MRVAVLGTGEGRRGGWPHRRCDAAEAGAQQVGCWSRRGTARRTWRRPGTPPAAPVD